jgi:hypothetical protein
MKKALISPNEVLGDGARVAQVADVDFPVAVPLFWVDCDDSVTADMVYANGVFTSLPEPEPTEGPTPPSGDLPVTEL